MMTDDADRLGSLIQLDILDTPPEPEFEGIVHLAQKFCKTGCALVSLVAADRQWFKARVGFDACETPIEQSVCAHALKAGDLLVIPDLTLDPRTRNNTLVTGEPRIRFYAGAVLKAPEGTPVGALCVIDGAPRPQGLTPDQEDALRVLAKQATALLAMRQAVTARDGALAEAREARRVSLDRALASEAASATIRQMERRLREAQAAGGIGTFDVEIETDACSVSPELCRIYGLPVVANYPLSTLQELTLYRDRARVSTRETRADGTADREVEYRIHRANDGAVRWLWRRAEFQGAPTPQRMLGVVQDITERKLDELRSRALIAIGETLRDAATIAEAADLAARSLGETLGVSRAGYASVDTASQIATFERGWAASNMPRVAGPYPFTAFPQTIDRLKLGAPLVISNVPAATWLRHDLAMYLDINVMAQIQVPLLQNGELVGVIFVHSAKARTWSARETDFVQAVADLTYAVIAKLAAEAQQRLMNEELSHRLKNTLAMVQAIASQTLRGMAETDALRTFEDRIIALSRAHDVLLQQSWTAARIDAVVEGVVSLHGQSSRIDVNGPNLNLGPKAALSLSLLLHELATNAVKYGALSNATGRVKVGWGVRSDGPAPNLAFSWIERGGPPAAAPKRRGFGTKLIGMGIAGAGNVNLIYAADGLAADFWAPLSTVTQI